MTTPDDGWKIAEGSFEDDGHYWRPWTATFEHVFGDDDRITVDQRGAIKIQSCRNTAVDPSRRILQAALAESTAQIRARASERLAEIEVERNRLLAVIGDRGGAG